MDRAAVAGPGDQVQRLEAVEHVLERLGLGAVRVAAPDVEGEAGGVDSGSGPDGSRHGERRLRTRDLAHALADVDGSAKASGRSPPSVAGRRP